MQGCQKHFQSSHSSHIVYLCDDKQKEKCKRNCIVIHVYYLSTSISLNNRQEVSGIPWPVCVLSTKNFHVFIKIYNKSDIKPCWVSFFTLQEHIYSCLQGHKTLTYHTGIEAKNMSALGRDSWQMPTQIYSETQREEILWGHVIMTCVSPQVGHIINIWNVSTQEACIIQSLCSMSQQISESAEYLKHRLDFMPVSTLLWILN